MKKTWVLAKIGAKITPSRRIALDDVIDNMETAFQFKPRDAADIIDHEIIQFDSEEDKKVKGRHLVELQIKLLIYHDSDLDQLMEILACNLIPDKDCPGVITDIKLLDYEMEDSR